MPFSPLQDESLPEGIAGLILGGGYPELHAKALSKNTPMRKAVHDAVADGLPTIAECGGFLYLHETLCDDEGVCYQMCIRDSHTSLRGGGDRTHQRECKKDQSSIFKTQPEHGGGA